MGIKAVNGFLVNRYIVDKREKILKKSEGDKKPFEKNLNILAKRINQVGGFLLYPLSFVLTNGKNALEVEYKKNYNRENEKGIYVKSLNDKIVATRDKKGWMLKKPHFVVVALMVVLVVVMILPEIVGLALKGISHINKKVREEDFYWVKKHFEEKYYVIGSKEKPIEGFFQNEVSDLVTLHTRDNKGYLRRNKFHQEINVIVHAKDLKFDENNETACDLNRLFYHESKNCCYKHKKVILVGSRFTGDGIGKKGLVKELEKRNFLLKETKFSDDETSSIFQKHFKTVEEAKAYKAPINRRTLKRYNVICLVPGSEVTWSIKRKSKKV